MRALPVSLVAFALLSPWAARAEEYGESLCSGYAAQYDAAPSQDNIGKLMSSASCHEKGHRLADALAAWKRVERDTTNAGTKRTAGDNVTRLEQITATIEVGLRPGASPVTATVDGAPAPLGAQIRVNAGEHTIATSDGASTKHASVDGERFAVLVPLESAPATGAGGSPSTGSGGGPSEAPPKTGSSAMLYGGIAAISIGGLGVIGFAVTGALSLSKNAELDEHCNDDRTDCTKLNDLPAAREIADTGKSLNIANVVMLAVGVVGVAVGVPLVVVGARSRNTTVVLAPPVPWATNTAGGVVWGGAF